MFSEIRPKSCTYSCGVEIYWNTEENTYYELYSRKKHICPNLIAYNKDSTGIPPATASKPSYYTKELSNINESTTKIQIKPNMDNSFEFLEGSSNRIKRYYEFLSDVIRGYNGKIHGSHAHLSNNGICLVVYYEVPKGKRDEIKKKIENFINYK
ncbi:MAG TPA: hypothetical protein VJ697_14685 [Nitrososphaeraceae archaeon]|nr:hypothetical protein [Nitrososphaeraceae archaeon]